MPGSTVPVMDWTPHSHIFSYALQRLFQCYISIQDKSAHQRLKRSPEIGFTLEPTRNSLYILAAKSTFVQLHT